MNILDYYEQVGFDCVQIAKNSKMPIEKDWVNVAHKKADDWRDWLKNGYNLGVKTGERSGITVIDFDGKIPDEIKEYIVSSTLTQQSTKGVHLVFKYEKDLPSTRIEALQIDVLNDGKQFIVAPSRVGNIERYWRNCHGIMRMPKELKEYLLKRVKPIKRCYEDVEINKTKFAQLPEGMRNASFIKMGGILRKELNLKQTEYVLKFINNTFCKERLPNREIYTITKSLDQYIDLDEHKLKVRVLEYLKHAEDARRIDVERALNEPKAVIDKLLNQLVIEGQLLKKGIRYCYIKHVAWEDDLNDHAGELNFKVPYFNDIGFFYKSEMILIGSRTKFGKTHIAMNIIERLVAQGVKPYYVSLETGSRFKRIARQRGLQSGDFNHIFLPDPTMVELESGVTIIDWLCPEDFAKVDKIFKHFIEQLYKSKGFLFVFMQLREDENWFAANLVKQFPTLSTKYVYTDDEGVRGKFIIDAIRDPKGQSYRREIPCEYDWKTKELRKVDGET